MPILSHRSRRVYYGLITLLAYAHSHDHSRQWVSAIAALLAREGVR